MPQSRCTFAGLVANSGVGRTRMVPTPVSHFVNLRKSETEREQLVLLAYRPGTREVEPFAQPQHGFKPPDRASCRAKGLEAVNLWHGCRLMTRTRTAGSASQLARK